MSKNLKMDMGKYNKFIEAMQNNKPLDSGASGKERKSFVKISEEKKTFRFLPAKDGDPFKFVHRHFDVPKKGHSLLCLKHNQLPTTGIKCPICDFSWNLFGEFKNVMQGRRLDDLSPDEKNLPRYVEAAEHLKLWKELKAKKQIFTQVVVRGEEELGAQTLWLTEATFKQILTIMDEGIEDEEEKDICDVVTGSDFKIFKVPSQNSFGTIKVVHMGSKPLSKDTKIVNTILDSIIDEPIKEWPSETDLVSALNERFGFNEKDAEKASVEKSIPAEPESDTASDADALEDELSRFVSN